ncbi:ABC transporter permease [Marinagarivorans algicola]|uniref:ABC transporter permease n=1 Tax=Marinagarivorans algicola TaxID=1513270 RepID=UPI0006B4BF82|nr:ABC transporter permease [Marinagarivorans algicola]
MSLDALQEVWFTLNQNRLRTFLTAFGVFWGIFMLVLLLGVGQGLKNGIEQSFSSDVRTSMWISSNKTSLPYRGLPQGRHIKLQESDVDFLKNQFPEINIIAAEEPLGSNFRADIYVTYGQHSGSFSVLGAGANYFKIKKSQNYHYGRRLNDLDEADARKVVVIGTKVAERLFGNEYNPIGHQIAINGVSVKIVGVFYDSGWEGRMSERIYMPLAAFQKTFGKGQNIGSIAVVPHSDVDNVALSERILGMLKERHKISPQDNTALRLFDLAKETEEINNTFTGIGLFLWFVGLGTLMAGIVGISNIMIISVKERTREIGIRKALGAHPRQIIYTILSESLLVTLIAGYVGLVLSVGLLELYNWMTNEYGIELPYFSHPEVDVHIAIVALLILVCVGTVAGLVPAWQAARISPIEAMREET